MNIRKISFFILTEIFSYSIFLKFFFQIFKIITKKSIIFINPENLIINDQRDILKIKKLQNYLEMNFNEKKKKLFFVPLKNFLKNENILKEKIIFFNIDFSKNEDFLKEIEDPKNLLIFLKIEKLETKIKKLKNRSPSICIKKKIKYSSRKKKTSINRNLYNSQFSKFSNKNLSSVSSIKKKNINFSLKKKNSIEKKNFLILKKNINF